MKMETPKYKVQVLFHFLKTSLRSWVFCSTQYQAGSHCEAVISEGTYVRSAVCGGDFLSLVTLIRFLATVAPLAVGFSLKIKIHYFQ